MKALQVKVWLLVLGAVAGLLALASPILEPWEERLADHRYRGSNRSVPLDERIQLVLIDDKSLENLKAPLTFWAPHFSRVCKGLIENEAAAVGLDWLPYDLDSRVFTAIQPFYPELGDLRDNPWLPLFLATQERERNPMVQGIYPPNFQTSVAPGMQEQYRPASELMAVLGPQQMGFLNLSRDPDGVLRRQTVLPLQLKEPLWGAPSYPPFAARLAEVASGQTLEPGQAVWNNRPLPLLEDGTLRIAYPPAAGLFPSHSFSDVLGWDDKKLRQTFAGKIVLIGAGTKLFQDLVETPLGEIFGVEAHACTLNTLLTENFVRDANLLQVGMVVLLTAGVAGGLGLVLSLPPAVALLLLLEGGYLLLTGWLFNRHSLLFPWLGPSLGMAASFALCASWRARHKAEEERYVRRLFGRYVSPAVMEVLLKDPGQTALGAVGKRRITVLFTDINGFSGHCEKKSPEQIMLMLNDYFQHMNSIIFKHGGTIKQFVGDEIMAMYGAPLEHNQAEVAAVLSAVEMVRHLESLRAADPDEEKGFYYIKAGIHSGDVILGNVGSHERTEYAAVGDDVNLGSRLMGMTKALQADILISKEVYEKVKHLPGMTFKHKGAHPVKGRVEPVEIYQVIPLEGNSA